MNSPLFSIVIPTHNRLPLLQQALESVWDQRFSDYEVIVVDDGSCDGTWEYLNGLGEQVIAIRQDNKGPGAARNAGSDRATGRYIAFLDSDDCWYPWTLEIYKYAITAIGSPAWISGTHYGFCGGEKCQVAPQAAVDIVRYPDYLASAPDGLWLGVPGTAIRRDVFNRHRFRDENINAEDNDLWLRLGVESDFGFIASPPVFSYRRHGNSRVAELRLSAIGALDMLNRERSGKYPGGADRKEARLSILSAHLRPVAVACARSGLRREAVKIYRELFAWHLGQPRLRFLLGLPFLVLASQFKLRGRLT